MTRPRTPIRAAWKEIDVGCQSCHGPGGDHIEWARAGGRGAATGLVVGFKANDSRYEVDACASCHSRRFPHRRGRAPRSAALRHLPARVAARGALPRRRAAAGRSVRVRLVSPEQDVPARRPLQRLPQPAQWQDQGGGQCGVRPMSPTRSQLPLPTLAHKVYDAPVHHFHKAGSPGAQCVSCHMPTRDYMNRGRAAGSHPAATPARSLGQARDAECVHRLPP